MPTTLVLGGARSGKSAFAQQAAQAAAAKDGRALVMIATADAGDDEMAARIAQHKDSRGPAWRTVEAPLALPEAIACLQADEAAVVDCLTLWMTNVMMRKLACNTVVDALAASVARCPAPLWLVSNEVGWGIVPDNALARRFRDACGRLHQRLAAQADHVILIAAGLPLSLK